MLDDLELLVEDDPLLFLLEEPEYLEDDPEPLVEEEFLSLLEEPEYLEDDPLSFLELLEFLVEEPLLLVSEDLEYLENESVFLCVEGLFLFVVPVFLLLDDVVPLEETPLFLSEAVVFLGAVVEYIPEFGLSLPDVSGFALVLISFRPSSLVELEKDGFSETPGLVEPEKDGFSETSSLVDPEKDGLLLTLVMSLSIVAPSILPGFEVKPLVEFRTVELPPTLKTSSFPKELLLAVGELIEFLLP